MCPANKLFHSNHSYSRRRSVFVLFVFERTRFQIIFIHLHPFFDTGLCMIIASDECITIHMDFIRIVGISMSKWYDL